MQTLLARFTFLFMAATTAALAAPRFTLPETEVHDVGGYLLNNNVWGKAKSPAGWQLIDLLETGLVAGTAAGSAPAPTATVSWQVRYDWPEGSDPHSVKCYPSVVNGWQWGLRSKDPSFPVTVGELASLRTSARVEVANPGVQNLAYDLWFHEAGAIGAQPKPTDELMVWCGRFGGAGPLGEKEAELEIDGAKWTLFVGDIGWKVFSFIREENAAQWDLDLQAFITFLVKRGLMAPTKQLTGVQFGTEVFRTQGEGRVAVHDYAVSVRQSAQTAEP